MARKVLEGLRVAVLAADGFEQVEVTRPIKRLQREGAKVCIISLRRGEIRGMNFLWKGKKLDVDETVFSADLDDYDALLLPGGFVNPDLLRQSEKVLELVRAWDRAGKPIATLCHGPQVLISANLVNARKLTSWPGIRDDVMNAGGLWVDEPVVKDGNWVSSRGPKDLLAFDDAMVELFASRLNRKVRPVQRARRYLPVFAAAAGLAGAVLVARRAAGA